MGYETSPTGSRRDQVRLYEPEFAADPHRAYDEMRARFGAIAPVELAPGVPAMLVLDYATALRIMRDPQHFPADPSRWQRSVPEDCPVRPFLEARPNALRTTGEAHRRFRGSFSALREVDLNRLHDLIGHAAEELINGFCGEGGCDLLSRYAAPLTFQVLANLMGFPTEAARQAWAGMAAMLDTVDAQAGQEMFIGALAGVVADKRASPGHDLTSALITDPGRLDDVEVINQAALLFSMGTEPLANLILHTMLLMLSDDRFGSGLISGALSTEDALDEVLFEDPPLTNFSIMYPRQPILVDEVWLPADQPVLIGLAACNNDPRIAGGDRTGNRSHLAWGAGPHACPAQTMARTIAQDAIDLLIDALPDMKLAIPVSELSWRPGPFHRALVSLPVEFPATAPMQIATSSRFEPSARL
ncbi:cytochrome P450 [Nocardia coffeae]|uniref:cytochrome P450 n=1 Tax=Nocardia coffeae TaxID=2873381 RepID=UPI0027E0D144|nr:cytochrome P450 [Nocardia coffeae]